MFNSYYIRARLFPTILTIVPLILFLNRIIAPFYYDTLKDVLNILPLLTNISLSTALLFLMVQINRLVSKEVFQRFYFKDELQMPTTNNLLWSSVFFESSIKNKIRSKINLKYEIVLMTQEEERASEQNARKQICIAVSQIRNSLRDNKLLLQHNIEYGFFRNLLGGSLIAMTFSVFIIIYGSIEEETVLKLTGIVLSIIYFVPVVFSNPIIKRFGNYYSKVLYEQFLSLETT